MKRTGTKRFHDGETDWGELVRDLAEVFPARWTGIAFEIGVSENCVRQWGYENTTPSGPSRKALLRLARRYLTKKDYSLVTA